MNEFNPEQFEADLRTLRPAKPSPKLVKRVLAELSGGPKPDCSRRGSASARRDWWGLLRWLVPVAAASAVLAVLLFEHRNQSQNQPGMQRQVSVPPLKADKVEIERQLLADFDAVASLPSGEPVRFRCHQWMDKVRLRDSAAGLVIERSAPRLEIVPVSFETY